MIIIWLNNYIMTDFKLSMMPTHSWPYCTGTVLRTIKQRKLKKRKMITSRNKCTKNSIKSKWIKPFLITKAVVKLSSYLLQRFVLLYKNVKITFIWQSPNEAINVLPPKNNEIWVSKNWCFVIYEKIKAYFQVTS